MPCSSAWPYTHEVAATFDIFFIRSCACVGACAPCGSIDANARSALAIEKAAGKTMIITIIRAIMVGGIAKIFNANDVIEPSWLNMYIANIGTPISTANELRYCIVKFTFFFSTSNSGTPHFLFQSFMFFLKSGAAGI